MRYYIKLTVHTFTLLELLDQVFIKNKKEEISVQMIAKKKFLIEARK